MFLQGLLRFNKSFHAHRIQALEVQPNLARIGLGANRGLTAPAQNRRAVWVRFGHARVIKARSDGLATRDHKVKKPGQEEWEKSSNREGGESR
jgi:hypothetical protein